MSEVKSINDGTATNKGKAEVSAENKRLDGAGSWRLVAYIVPGSFLRPVKVVSTVFSNDVNRGETCIAEVDALNGSHAEKMKKDWKVLQKHESPKAAIKYHNERVFS